MKRNLIQSILKKTAVTLVMGVAVNSASGLVLEGTQANAATIGWKQTSNGSWYYYNANGNLTLGWQNINGNWYYLDTETGVMVTGWKYVNGTWYYLNNPSGEMATGWLYVGGTWYYLDTSSGAMYTGTHIINGKSEHFTESGAWIDSSTKTGWQKDANGTWYYYTADGSLAKGWLNANGTWYYLDNSSGAMYTGTHVINGKSEYFTESGAWVPNNSSSNTTDTNTSAKPETKPDTNTSSKPETKPDTNTSTKPETKPDNNTTDANTTNKNEKISLEEFTKIADDTMLDLVNKHRAEKGLNPLKWNDKLAMTSTEKSEHMRKHNYMGHVYNGVNTGYLQSLRYKMCIDGENAAAYVTPPLTKSGAIDMANILFNKWKNSPGHDRQMLDPEHTEMGYGFAISNGGTQYGSYAIQQFWDGEEYEEGSITMRSLVDGSWITDESPDYLKELV